MIRFLLSVFYIAALGVASHFIGEAVPRQKIDPARFKPYSWEDGGRVYRRIGVHKWKDLLPDKSVYVKSMVKKHPDGKFTAQSLNMLIIESCIAEATHVALIMLSPVILLLTPGVAGAIVWATDVVLFNLPFIIIQRYDRPRYAKLARRFEGRDSNEAACALV